jgi:hypothetical protein
MKRIKDFLASPAKVFMVLSILIYAGFMIFIQTTEFKFLNFIFGIAGVFVTETIRNMRID